MSETNQVPHPGPTIVRRHRTKFSRPGHLVRTLHFCATGVRGGQVYDVTSPSLISASWTPSRYVVSLLLFSEIQPTGLSGFSFLPAFRNYTSQQLAVQLRRIFLYGPLLYCMCYVRRCRNPMVEMCFCCGSTEGGRG